MASSLRLPAGSFLSAIRSSQAVPPFRPVGTSSTSAKPCRCRYFSQTSISQKGMRGAPQNMTPKQPAQPSMKTRGNQMSKAEMPQDLGLLPGTFIRPLWRDMPSIFQLPRERLQLEWLWIKQGVQNFFGERRQVGREFHQRMYNAFAQGDIPTLRKICCTGLANNLSARISHRPKDEQVTWSLEKYNRTPATFFSGIRVVADRASQIPDVPNSGVRQVVLRITSRQSTGKVKLPSNNRDAQSTELEAENATPAKQQNCTEYIVIQKLMWFGEEQEWRIWGHATPTTVEDLQSPFFAPGMSLADRLDAMKASMEGKRSAGGRHWSYLQKLDHEVCQSTC